MDYDKRAAKLRTNLAKAGLDSFLVTNRFNIAYLSGHDAEDSFIFITAKKKYFITDSRYYEEALDRVKGYEVVLAKRQVYSEIEDIIVTCQAKKTGFESMDIPYGPAMKLIATARASRFVPMRGVCENIRALKEPAEIDLIRKSIAVAKTVLKTAMSSLKRGMTEKEIARDIEIGFISRKTRPAFTPIVAIDENASKPHASATDKRLGKDSAVMIDIGCNRDGYNSDITRVVSPGNAPERFKAIYNIVKEAQTRAIRAVRPGARISDIDSACRGYIEREGYGGSFGHSSGHGVGLDVHEEPTISRHNEARLRKGMVFTLEPAIYLPGFGGVRIEDMVLVTGSGCEILTR